MEAYYKERKKQLNFIRKQIKKHAKNGQMELLSQAKKDYTKLLLSPPSFKREFYQKEENYLQELKKYIREKENKFIEFKLDICYDIYTGSGTKEFEKEFDEYEKTIQQLKKQQDKMVTQKKQREDLAEKTKKSQEDQRKSLLDSYPFLELEDKKTTYKELQKQLELMANPTRKVIAYEIDNQELEYRLTQLYQPVVDVKIAV
jgi:hypothetical protein